MPKWLKQIDDIILQNIWLAIGLVLMLVLRIPNWFEPYWYGDEAIYLTVGNALRQGELLYAQIVDHKTPIIYYLAMVPHQIYFKLILFILNAVSIVGLYFILRQKIKWQLSLAAGMLVFVLLTCLPWLEGHIANAELFLMAPIILALAVLALPKKLENKHYLYAGLLSGLAILTKVPAIFDAAGVISLVWFMAVKEYWPSRKMPLSLNLALNFLGEVIKKAGIFLAAIVGLVALSALYFFIRQTWSDYLQFGLLYNFRYAATWQPTLQNNLVQFFIPLAGKVGVAGVVIVFITLLSKKLSAFEQTTLTWFMLALVGATLSNRPYPHYLQQLVPAAAMILAIMLDKIFNLLARDKNAKTHGKVFLSLATGLLVFAGLVIHGLDFGLYSTSKYYGNFFKLATKQQNWDQYANQFNGLVADNYAAAKIIGETNSSEIFIWGTNPMLYALTKTSPTGKFTVAFHIKDFNAYEETMTDLTNKSPEFVIVMDNEEQLPGLYSWLDSGYIPHANFEHFVLYKKM